MPLFYYDTPNSIDLLFAKCAHGVLWLLRDTYPRFYLQTCSNFLPPAALLHLAVSAAFLTRRQGGAEEVWGVEGNVSSGLRGWID